MKGFGVRLKRLRMQNFLTQTELAGKLGINVNTYYGYESDRREPPLETVIALADFFSITVDALLREEAPRGSLEELLSSAGYELESKADGELRIITPSVLVGYDDRGVVYETRTPTFAANFPADELHSHIVDLLRLAAAPYIEMCTRRYITAANELHLPIAVARERHSSPAAEMQSSFIQSKKK